MPTWVPITLQDLYRAKVAELVDALRQQALANGQEDPMPGSIADTVAELRSCIGFCVKYQVDVDPTLIPPNLLMLAALKVIRRMKGRLQQLLDPDETLEELTYQKRLILLKDGEWPVDLTDNPIPTPEVQSPGGRITVVNSRPKTTSRQLDRL